MTLILSKLDAQMTQLGQEMARQAQRRGPNVARARRLLVQFSEALDALRLRVAETRGGSAAIPTSEPLNQTYPLPPHPARATLVATDGSSVEPDRHGPALYYLINVSRIVYEHGSGKRPVADSAPQLAFGDEGIYENGRLVQGPLLDTRLAMAELRELAGLSAQHSHPTTPLLAMSDGSLLLSQDERSRQRASRLAEVFRHFGQLAQAHAALAGFVSRPRHTDVVQLLYLASENGYSGDRQRIEHHPFGHLTDRELFSFLEPGERSATFISSLPVNADYQRRQPSYQIRFFYLNVGDERDAEIARVEMPAWAFEMPCPDMSPVAPAATYSMASFAHAAICHQCRIAGHYPYVLARAHELAMVSAAERQDLDMRILAALARQGLSSRPSEKARLKELTGTKRGRRRS